MNSEPLSTPPGPCWNERHDLMRDVAAAAWGYRVAYEGYWGAGVPDSDLTPETKARMLAALVGWQTELDRALAAMDETAGDFDAAKQAHRETIERLDRQMMTARDTGRSPLTTQDDHECKPELAREGEAICWSCGAVFIYTGKLTPSDLEDVRRELMEFGRDV